MASLITFNKNDIAYPKVLADKLNKVSANCGSENRIIKVDGNDFLGSNTSLINFSGGTDVNLSGDTSTGVLTIDVINTDTHRPIKVDGSDFLGDNTTALNLSGGTGILLSGDTSTGVLTIDSVGSDTHRPIQIDSVEKLNQNTSTALDLIKGTNISLNADTSGNVTIKANIPKKENELIYYDESKTDEYDGLFTQQLMYEDGIVVDNMPDFHYCTGSTSWEEIDFTMHDVAVNYVTDLTSCNPYKEGSTASTLSNSGFEKGAIINSSNAFWGYDSSKDYITAKFNDSWGGRTAFIYNENGADEHFIHDGLYGFSSSNGQNDGIGVAFYTFNKTVFNDGETKTYGDATVNETSYLKTTQLKLDLGVRSSSIISLGLSQYKKKPDNQITYLADSYWRNGASDRDGAPSCPQPYKAYGPKSSYGFSIIGTGSSSLIKTNNMITNPGGYNGKGGTVGFIRCSTERDGNIYRFKFSTPTGFTWSSDYKHTIGPQVVVSDIILNMDTYKIIYKQTGATEYTTINITDSEQKSLFDEFKNNTVYFGFWQFSTPYGSIYNISYTKGSGSVLSNLILNTYNDTVWQYTYDGWKQLQYVPLDLFTGSRLNFNHLTKKLFYSTGSVIYQLAGSFNPITS